MWGSGSFLRFALIMFSGVLIATTAWALNGGPVGLNILTLEGRSQLTSIVWVGNSRELTVVNLTDPLAPGSERDVYDTLRMLVQRCTAVNISQAGGRDGGPGGCCPALSGTGMGFAGNAKAKLRIDQAFESGRVRQTVTIYGYKGRPFDSSVARLLFQ
jgi:hypothetical protein